MFMFATLTESDDLSLYLINGVSGKVMHKYIERKVKLSEPISVAFSENTLVVCLQRFGPNGLA